MDHVLRFFRLLAVLTPICGHTQTLDWAVPFIGADESRTSDIAVDASGNSYVVGIFEGTLDVDPGPDEQLLTAAGPMDIYAVKLDPQGQLAWAYQCGGASNNSEFARGIAVDATGNVYINGAFTGTSDFDPGPAVVELTSAGNPGILDGFLVKLDADGDLIWAKRFGGPNADRCNGIALDLDGNIYCSGFVNSTAEFSFNSGTITLPATSTTGFVLKMDPTGSTGWVRPITGGNGLTMTVDVQNNVYVAGFFLNTIDLDPGEGIQEATSAGGSDMFVCKLNEQGTLVWGRAMGGTDENIVSSIAVDQAGNLFATGYFKGTADFDPGPEVVNRTVGFYQDAFLFKFDEPGDLEWVHVYGAAEGPGVPVDYLDAGYGVACDGAGNVYACGLFTHTVDFDGGPGVHDISVVGIMDLYLLKLSSAGELMTALALGGISGDLAQALYVNQTGDQVHVAGAFSAEMDFAPGPDTYLLSTPNTFTGYVMQLEMPVTTDIGADAPPSTTASIRPNPGTDRFSIATTPTDREIQVFDATGRLVIAQRTTGMNTEVNTNALRPGLYSVKLDDRASMRWVKE